MLDGLSETPESHGALIAMRMPSRSAVLTARRHAQSQASPRQGMCMTIYVYEDSLRPRPSEQGKTPPPVLDLTTAQGAGVRISKRSRAVGPLQATNQHERHMLADPLLASRRTMGRWTRRVGSVPSFEYHSPDLRPLNQRHIDQSAAVSAGSCRGVGGVWYNPPPVPYAEMLSAAGAHQQSPLLKMQGKLAG